MKTVIAETVLLGKEAFESLGETAVIPDRLISSDSLKDADLLIVRSKTKVTPELIKNSPVRFVGTATAGFEHLDTQALDQLGIGWTAAPGCNADSVAEYIITALLHLHRHNKVPLEGKTLGIIGVGQVGSRVAARAAALGLRILINDPPRAEKEGQAPFQSLETILSESDIVTVHTPLITDGPWPTRHLADRSFFERMRPGSVFMNAARGKILDTDALLDAKEKGIVAHAVLDVWDPEPGIRTDALQAATLGTPHIAGHSLEGKLNGTVQCFDQACRHLKIDAHWNPAPYLPSLKIPEQTINSTGKSDLDVLFEAASALYAIEMDDQSLRSNPTGFDRLRAEYSGRREFFNTQISLTETRTDLLAKLKQIGFSIRPE